MSEFISPLPPPPTTTPNKSPTNKFIQKLGLNVATCSNGSYGGVLESDSTQQLHTESIITNSTQTLSTVSCKLSQGIKDHVNNAPSYIQNAKERVHIAHANLSASNNMSASNSGVVANSGSGSPQRRIRVSEMGGCNNNTTVTDIPPFEDVIRWKQFRRKQKDISNQESLLMQQQSQSISQCSNSSSTPIVGRENNIQSTSTTTPQSTKATPRNNTILPRASSKNTLLEIVQGFESSPESIMSADNARNGDNSSGGSIPIPIDGSGRSGGNSSIPNLGSLSLSMSESPSTAAAAAVVKKDGAQDMSVDIETKGSSKVVEIDNDGFPISLSEEEGEHYDAEKDVQKKMEAALHVLDTNESKEEDNNQSNNTKQEVDTPNSIQSMEEYFSTLDVSVSGIRKQQNNQHKKTYSMASETTSSTSNSGGSGDKGGGSVVATRSNSGHSEVPTEIVSNTARYVANQSNLMARRMMAASSNQDGDGKEGGKESATQSNIDNFTPLVVKTAPTPTATTATAKVTTIDSMGMPITTQQNSNSVTNTLPSSFIKQTPQSSNKQSSKATSAARHRLNLAATPAGVYTPAFSEVSTPGWDQLNTTVTNEQIDDVMATPEVVKNEESSGDDKVNDSETWVGTAKEGDDMSKKEEDDTWNNSWEHDDDDNDVEVPVEEKDQEENDTSMVSNGDGGEKNISMVSPLSLNITQQEDEQGDKKPDPSPSNKSQQSSTSSKDIPTTTLDDVNNFMNQLKKLRKDETMGTTTSTNQTKKAPIVTMEYLPAASEKEVIVNNDENDHFTKSLMERKEKLRQHKLESDRMKREFDQRLQALRSKVYEDDVNNIVVKEEEGDDASSMLPGVDKTPPPKASVSRTLSEKVNDEEEGEEGGKQEDLNPLPETKETAPSSDEKKAPPSKPAIRFSPMVPAARWSGGLARWGPSTPSSSNSQPPPPPTQTTTTPQAVKLKIGVDEDDFSFKPPSLSSAGGGAKNIIAISPIAANSKGAASGSTPTKFNFTLSSPDNMQKKAMGTLLTIGNAASSKLSNNNNSTSASTSKLSLSPTSKISLSPVSMKRKSIPPPKISSSLDTTVKNVGVFPLTTPKKSPIVQTLSPPEAPSQQQQISSPMVIESIVLNDTLMEQQLQGRDPSEVGLSQQGRDPSEVGSSPPASSTSGGRSSTSGASPMSEGDKGGGIGCNFPLPRGLGDRSIVTTSSSKMVELGENTPNDPPEVDSGKDEEDESLLGYTITPRKKKKKKLSRSLRSSPLFETVDEVSKGSTQEESEGGESISSKRSRKSLKEEKLGDKSNRKSIDPDGSTLDELEKKRKEAATMSSATGKRQTRRMTEPSALSLDIVQESDNEEFVAVMDRAKAFSFTPIQETNQEEKHDSTDFTSVMKRAKAFTPRETNQEKHDGSTDFNSVMDRAKAFTPREDSNQETDFNAVMDRSKVCLTPRDANQNQDEAKNPTTSRLDVSEENKNENDDEFNTVMNRVKTCMTPREVGSTTTKPHKVESFGGNKRSLPSTSANIHQLRSRFESSGIVASPVEEFKKREAEEQDAARNEYSSKLYEVPVRKEVPSPNEIKDSEESNKQAFKGRQSPFENLRSRFESSSGSGEKKEKSYKRSVMTGQSSMIGNGLYLSNSDIQAMSSLESTTNDTEDSSLIKAESYETGTLGDDTIGDGTLNTKKVRYAKILERRDGEAEDDESMSAESETQTEPSVNEQAVAEKVNSLRMNWNLKKMAYEVGVAEKERLSAEEEEEEEEEVAVEEVKSPRMGMKWNPTTMAYEQVCIEEPVEEPKKVGGTAKSFETSIEQKDTDKAIVSKSWEVKQHDTKAKEETEPSSFSSVKNRMQAFESKKSRVGDLPQYSFKKKVASSFKKESSFSPMKKDRSISPKKDDIPAPMEAAVDTNVSSTASIKEQSSVEPEDDKPMSIKDKIAAFGGGKQQRTPGKVPTRSPVKVQQKPVVAVHDRSSPAKAVPSWQNRGPNKVMPTMQQQQQQLQQKKLSPPRTIDMNQANNNTPSPLWVANQNGQGYSPIDNTSPQVKPNTVKRFPTNRSSINYSPIPRQNQRHDEDNQNIVAAFSRDAGLDQVRPEPIQTRYESPIPSEYGGDEDEEDGITLSPTISEVSGLTIPTCIGSVYGDNFENTANNGPVHAMSPIARHRHQQESPISRHRRQQQEERNAAVVSTSGGNISTQQQSYLHRASPRHHHQQQQYQHGLAPSTSVDTPSNHYNNTHERIQQMKTPKSRGSWGGGNSARRDKLVQQVKAKTSRGRRSQEWQQANVIKEQQSVSRSTSGENVEVEYQGGNSSRNNPRGRVMESVQQMNRRNQQPYHHRMQNRRDQQGSSLATQDCYRVD